MKSVKVLLFLHLILFKYHLFTFKYTHSILFKNQEYFCLTIFEKPMIQVHGRTILSMGFKILNRNPILIGNIKAQFSLTLLYQKRKEPKTIKAWQKKKAQDYQRLAKKKYHVKMLPWQKRTIAIIL